MSQAFYNSLKFLGLHNLKKKVQSTNTRKTGRPKTEKIKSPKIW